MFGLAGFLSWCPLHLNEGFVIFAVHVFTLLHSKDTQEKKDQ